MDELGVTNGKLSRTQVQLLTGLFHRQGWLADKQNAIYELLDMCNSLNEQELLYELFHRFTYINDSKYARFLENVTDKLINDWQLSEKSAIIVATSHDRELDSSQIVLSALRDVLTERGWYTGGTGVLINTASRALRKLGGRDSINIVLVDEFVGTGSTMINTIKELATQLEKVHHIGNYMIKVCVLASMESGKIAIENNGTEVYANYLLKKGISEHYVGQQLRIAYSHMLRLESLLQQQIDATLLPSFGHGGAEALYARKQGLAVVNTPNSVFPIFWWPKYNNGTTRITVLQRARL